MGTPHPRPGPEGGNDWRTACKEKYWHWNDDRAPNHTHSETEIKDRKIRLYGRQMITWRRSLSGKLYKRRSIRDSDRPTSSNSKDQEGESSSRERNHDRSHDFQEKMVRRKNTQSKRGPQGEELPISARKITRMEQAAREAKGTFLEQVDTKGKAVIDIWEREVNTKHQGKAWAGTHPRSRRIRDPGATQPRKTLYHKTVEEAWHTKMLICKLREEKNETSRVANRGHKKEIIEILSHLSDLEASKRHREDQRNQGKKIDRLAGQFQLYLRYVHHMDITPADRRRTPASIRRMHRWSRKRKTR
jgi:hypothetical protein